MDIADMEISVHAVATALKSFFSQLPEPLVPRTTQEEFLNRFRGMYNFHILSNVVPEFWVFLELQIVIQLQQC